MFAYGIDIGCLFEFAVFIDALFDEYLFKRSEMILLKKFVFADFEFLPDKILSAVG